MDINTLRKRLSDVGIVVGKYDRRCGSYQLSFKGDESQFVDALNQFMTNTGCVKQDSDWFPGDPGECGEQAYFIMNDQIQFCLSYDDMLMSDIVE